MKPIILITSFALTLALTGCGTVGQSAADMTLTGAGGYIGYAVSGKKIGGAAVGAGSGYLASKLFQNQFGKQLEDAERLGFDRAMNQSVKQQYWITQNLQKADAKSGPEPRFISIRIPETVTDDGTILKPATAILRTE